MRYSRNERQTHILRFVEQHQRVSLSQVCAQFAISVATARRDLEALADRGDLQRTHGGALVTRRTVPEPPVIERINEQAAAKRRIGQAAAALVGEGETIFLGSGTTSLEVALHLRDRKNLTVITNSLLVVNALSEALGVTLIVLGGMLRRSEMSLVGHITEQALAEVRADKVIISIRAIDIVQGLTNEFTTETMTDRLCLKIGREVIVVADHTKCGRVAPAFIAPIEHITTLVTNDEIPAAFAAALAERGIHVVQS